MPIKHSLLQLTLATLLCLPLAAKHGKHAVYGPYFREADTVVIARHCRVQSLPPGLQKKLYRTGHLPPGWEKKLAPFPVVVEQQLPPVCVGCRRGLIGNVAIVYDSRTSVILDIAIIR